VLVQTTSPEAALRVQSTPEYAALLAPIRDHAKNLKIVRAHNVKRIGDVDTGHQGLFLFNHFVADDRETMLRLWDYLAGWYEVETKLDNSIALMPDDQDTEFAVINWARWTTGAAQHFWSQLSKKSFWKYVTRNLEANHAASMPIYFRLA
jgi:hypothetical protein